MIVRKVRPEQLIFGGGVIDSLLNTFTAQRYPGEHHAYSLAPTTFGKKMSFMGPGTSLKDRLNYDYTPKPDSLPIRLNDLVCMVHDIAYDKIGKAYRANPTPENKKIQMQNIWKADDNFINDVKKDYTDPMSHIASKFMSLKKIGEQTGTIDSKRFSGFGKRRKKVDPAKKLRELVLKSDPKPKKVTKTITQDGGFIPAAVAVPVVASVLSTLTGKIFDLVRDKIRGSGVPYKIPFKYYSGLKNKQKFLDRLKNAQKRITL